MRSSKMRKTMFLTLGGAAVAMFLAGCPFRVTVRTPRPAPPSAPGAIVTCPAGSYARGGKYMWNRARRRWVWRRATCVARPATWRVGCRWRRGRWVRCCTCARR